MKFLQYLQEEYFDIIKVSQTNTWSSIYINPSLSDIMKLRKETRNNTLRFIVNVSNKSLFIFSDDVLHHYVITKFKEARGRIVMGIGHLSQGKIEIDDLYLSGYGTPEEIATWDFKWCARYFTNDIRQVIHRFMEEN